MFADLEKTFSKGVEDRGLNRGEAYMEAVMQLCNEKQIEQELAAKYLSKPII